MNKYHTLINILDQIRREAPSNVKFYHPSTDDIEKINQARSRALIHLYLKVQFGLLNYQDREKYVTDGSNDGGIDGYFIDKENREITFIQSKFRTTPDGFERREIKYEELLSMDTDRMIDGERTHENGSKYNGKILSMLDEIQEISNIGRYNYVVAIIANTKEISKARYRKLTSGLPVIEYNYDKVYNDLVFPVVTGTYFDQEELTIHISLDNKSSEEITYSVNTEFTECEISAMFVPTIEIARTMHKYKNSILKYNPRSFLDLAKGSVNSEIKSTIVNKSTNEFALFNNGITLLSDNTSLNKRIAKKGMGQLIVTNPQIINGGQTAYTLSRIYEECLSGELNESVFDNKEVLLKVITFSDDEIENIDNKNRLIEEISRATNQQSAIEEADRRSNDKVQIELQDLIYKRYGYFYQRKKGEFGEGLKYNYIKRNQIIDRDGLIRLALAVDGKPSNARRSSRKQLFKKDNFDKVLSDSSRYEEYMTGQFVYEELNKRQAEIRKEGVKNYGIEKCGFIFRYGKFAAVYAAKIIGKPIMKREEIIVVVDQLVSKWKNFEQIVASHKLNVRYFQQYVDEESGIIRQEINFDGFYKGATLSEMIELFWKK